MSVLYLVATPIGNLGDMSPRAAEVLSEVDFIAAEDTRVTMKLLSHIDVKKPLVSYYDRQKGRAQRAESIISRIAAGEKCALVTDAGMPAVSDPGEELVRLAAEAGITVSVIPGPCAAVCALALSGLPTAKWSFEGFLPSDKSGRRSALSALTNERRTMIFYEAPHRLRQSLADMEKAFGGARRISLCRELTKLYEEVERKTLAEAVLEYSEREPRGEYVLVVEGAGESARQEWSEEEAIAFARSLLEEGKPTSLAAKEAAKQSGVARAVIYRALVAE